jgi:hypothetical protein
MVGDDNDNGNDNEVVTIVFNIPLYMKSSIHLPHTVESSLYSWHLEFDLHSLAKQGSKCAKI